MSVSNIKRGVYTRVDSTGIESNKGTFFEAIMAPTFQIEMIQAAVPPTPAATVNIARTFCTVTGAHAVKIGTGGAADTLTLNRVTAAGVTAAICTFTIAAAADADWLLPVGFDLAVANLEPGDSLTLVGVDDGGAGDPAAEVTITVRID